MPKKAFLNLPEEKKERIRNAAIQLFGSLPYEEVTTRLLVKEAGISMGSLYQYFESKDEMYIYFIDELFTEIQSKKIAENVLRGDLEDYRPVKDFIDSMFFAPANVLEQYYFSKETNTYRINYNETMEKQKRGEVPGDVDAGLIQFLSGGTFLSVIMYTRSLGISTAEAHRKFWDDNTQTLLYFNERNIKYYKENLQKTGRQGSALEEDNLYIINKS